MSRSMNKQILDKSSTFERNMPLVDQLNRIDMMGVNRFVEAISAIETTNTPKGWSGVGALLSSKAGKKMLLRKGGGAGGTSGGGWNTESFGAPAAAGGGHRRLVTPEGSTVSVATVATAVTAMTASHRPTRNPPPPPSTSQQPHRPSSTPHSQPNNSRGRRNVTGSAGDPRSKMYATGGQGGDEDTIIVKMGQKEMAIHENPPPLILPVADANKPTVDACESIGSRASTDFGSVQFHTNQKGGDKPVAYHSMKGGDHDMWCSADLYRHNPVFETDQINMVSTLGR